MEIALPDNGQRCVPGKILCIGRNYAAHAAEMNSPLPERPLVFLKPSTALIGNGQVIRIPVQSLDVHHEVELVAVIGRTGKHISEGEALSYIAGYGVGIDMTARDIQAHAKTKGQPWTVAKGFDTFAPLGDLVSANLLSDPHNLSVKLTVNGETRQEGNTRDMIFRLGYLVSYLSDIFTLERGDLIYTGTPEGVGPVKDGDQLRGSITGLPDLFVSVKA